MNESPPSNGTDRLQRHAHPAHVAIPIDAHGRILHSMKGGVNNAVSFRTHEQDDTHSNQRLGVKNSTVYSICSACTSCSSAVQVFVLRFSAVSEEKKRRKKKKKKKETRKVSWPAQKKSSKIRTHMMNIDENSMYDIYTTKVQSRVPFRFLKERKKKMTMYAERGKQQR